MFDYLLSGNHSEIAKFEERNRKLIRVLPDLQNAVERAYRDLPSGENPSDLVIFALGRRCAIDFDDILLLCTAGRRFNARGVIRGMFERIVTAWHLHLHPEQTMDFVDYDFIQRRKVARKIEDVWGVKAENEKAYGALLQSAAEVESRFRKTKCKKCETTELNHSWSKMDMVSMAASVGERLEQLTIMAYYETLGHSHATFRSMSEQYHEVDGAIHPAPVDYGAVDKIMELAHLMLLESLLLQHEHFENEELLHLWRGCMADFREIWQASREVRPCDI
ncbi:MAG: hypothetical protein KY459_12160 [Acidobacteria bacterium]|nr:hypothetical protein [Acidobacteriota bacterium]